MPHFFLSYARQDAEGGFLDIFYGDLYAEVQLLKGKNEVGEEPGFRDLRSIEVGEDWNDQLVNALTTCRVFLALYSPSYFVSEFCGKEWRVFADRLAAPAGYPGEAAPPLIVPILWAPVDNDVLPEVTKRIQYTHESLGDLYASEGLHHLVRLRSHYAKEYWDLVRGVAKRVIQVAKQHQLPPTERPQDLKQILSAFRGPAEQSATGQGGSAPRGTKLGPKRVRFMVIAGTKTEHAAASLRKVLDCYGDEPDDWRPYQPSYKGQIGILAQSAATAAEWRVAPLPLPDANDLARELNAALQEREIVILIADAWAVGLHRYNELLRQYDSGYFLNSALLMPWSRDDQEMIDHATKLRNAVRATLLNKTRERDSRVFRDDIETADRFQLDLLGILVEVRRRIVEMEEVLRLRDEDNMIARPVLTGPSRV